MINDALCTLYMYIYSVFVQVQDICTSIHTDDLDPKVYVCTAPLPYLHAIYTVEAPKRGSSAGGDDVTT